MEALRANKEIRIMSEEKNYTIEDIEALPKGQRAELFDGEMVMMASPTTTHQDIQMYLAAEIHSYIKYKGGNCKIFASPFAVFLKSDGRNYLEPDITVICDRNKLDDKGCHGAPDWIIEVASPTSRKLDYGRKLASYIDAGVREYWIVDTEKKVVVVYNLEQPDIPAIYRFEDTVKVGIFEDLEIDLFGLQDIRYE